MNPLYEKMRTSVFERMSGLAAKHGAVNLGQGFPNFPAPDFIKKAAQDAIDANINQYARGAGQLRLVNALAQTYGPLFGRELDPMREIVVTDDSVRVALRSPSVSGSRVSWSPMTSSFTNSLKPASRPRRA